ncbi:PD-(D/E)XK nuclease family transposase [Selenomonas sp.]|uniref:PD-(D/E)XK nuclease family transposase n=1 Tax=Selenomonas sp. TaxID=2053611 RepID=UPI003FA2D897
MGWDEKEEWRQKFLQVLAGFRLLDDDFMTAAFQDNLECVDLVLQIILDKPQLKATKVTTQDTLKNLQGRSVRLDIHAFADGQEFNIEIQRSGKGAAERRARYNSSLMDANALLAGEDYDKLPESYVIFITETDVLAKGLPLYVVERVVKGINEDFVDGSHIIYVNSSMMDEETPLGKLMHDFRCTQADDMYYDVLAERVRYLKETEEGARNMCEAMEMLTDEAEMRGMERGMEQGKTAVILGMLKEKLPLEMIAKVSDISMDKIREIGKMHHLL